MTTFDTSTEAVERLLDGVTPGPWELRHNMAEDEVGEYAEGVSVVANGSFYVHEHDICFGDDVDALIEANARFIAAARDLVPALLKERDEARARLATPAPGAVQEAAIDIAAIENGGKRWHGEVHRVVAVRWEPYKPDGQRQMKAKGRWQEQVGSGDYWRWQNCDRPAALRAALAANQPAPVTPAEAVKGPRIVTFHTAGRFGVCIGGRWDGWVMVQHPDGYWVSHHKPDPVDPSIPALRAIKGADHE